MRRYGISLTCRTGVNTGEVVAGDPTTGQRLVTGDTVNVAARLEQAAPPTEVLIGELTYRLVRGAVEVEEVEPLELKGKAERVPAYRLLAVSDATEGFQRRQDAPMVGREREMATLSGHLPARGRRARLPDGHRHRRCRRRQVAPGPRVHHLRGGARRRCSGADACRTARASPSGRWSRWSARRPASSRTTRRMRRASKLAELTGDEAVTATPGLGHRPVERAVPGGRDVLGGAPLPGGAGHGPAGHGR